MSVIDWPNSPTNGDELQGPNKFVYEWTNDNRWKNVHRPLIVSDYIWPDYFLDPNVSGDDWTIEAIDFPVGNGQARIVFNMVVPQDPNVNTDPRTSGSVGVKRVNPLGGDHIEYVDAEVPNLLCQSILGGIPIAQAAISPGIPDPDSAGTAIFCNAQFSSISFATATAASWLRLSDHVSALGMGDLESVRMRCTFDASDVSFGGATQPIDGGLEGLTASKVPVGGTESKVSALFPPSGGASYTTPWTNLTSSCEFINILFKVGEGREMGNLVVEIEDPYGAEDRTNLPVGFATNPAMTRSLLSFAGSDGPILRTMHHYNPKAFTNTKYNQTTHGVDDNYLDLTNALDVDVNWTCLYMREDDNMYMFVDTSDLEVVQSRHLYTHGDYTTHSTIISGVYDFRNYTTQTQQLGYDVEHIRFSPDGVYLFTLDATGTIRRYFMSTAWDLSTVDPLTFTSLDMTSWSPECFDITIDGLAIIIFKSGLARQVLLETAWDITNVINSGVERAFPLVENPIDVCVSDDTLTMFILDIPVDTSVQYRIYSYTRNQ